MGRSFCLGMVDLEQIDGKKCFYVMKKLELGFSGNEEVCKMILKM